MRRRAVLARFSTGRAAMNRIIYIVGVVVIVLFILGYFGLR